MSESEKTMNRNHSESHLILSVGVSLVYAVHLEPGSSPFWFESLRGVPAPFPAAVLLGIVRRRSV